MANVLEPVALAGLSPVDAGFVPLPGVDREEARLDGSGASGCHHCGEPCDRGSFESAGQSFCCLGCQTVFSLLRDSGLDGYYRLGERPGIRIADGTQLPGRWGFLDEPAVEAKLLDFKDGKSARVTFHLPAIHCVACVWLLENLFRLNPGIGRSRVNFGRREISVAYATDSVRLGEVAALLSGLGYEPELTLAELDRPAAAPTRMLGLRIAVAGFAFGNIMLFSLPQYFGLDSFSGPVFRGLFGWLSLALALPAVVFSAADFWRAAFASLRQKALTLDVPIVAGLAAIYGQSVWEIISHTGDGYFDSLAGLIFFLLCGRAFQQKTYDRLGFDRDYRGFFPLAVVRRGLAGEETVSISSLAVGDRLILRHGELAPADARVVAGEGLMDYSFVSGESEPVARGVGEHVFAGGRQVGGAVEIETVKPVSQSYLTSLWNDEAFRKERDDTFSTLTNVYSRRFAPLVLVIALVSAAAWGWVGQPGRGLKAFVSVLIVACPCALALAAPFTLGSAQRLLGRNRVFLRNAQVTETLAQVDTVVFDKTGTLTAPEAAGVRFHGTPLSAVQAAMVASVCRQSTHPYSRRMTAALGGNRGVVCAGDFEEVAGKGLKAVVDGCRVIAGSRLWLEEQNVTGGWPELPAGGAVYIAFEGRCVGAFTLANTLRPEVEGLLRDLGQHFHLALLSGDNEREREHFEALFGQGARLHFNQSPREKLSFVRSLQENHRSVMMVGDGLNDAGALRQSDVGVAIVEGVGKFSPASDVIMDASVVPGIGRILDFSRRSARVVRAGFLISAAYNIVGVVIAAAGLLSPIVCAILMPLSSISVVLFAVGATRLAARRSGLSSIVPSLDDQLRPVAAPSPGSGRPSFSS